ncbi:hypothetical protein TWF481_002438 [Arthrobotrys musiformis]|uniref:Nucleoside phosphorylase domain-containing protein n=1 Tax=Arthrobotrys musiformis TaxID=47236 RepID=A0AAV9VT93_9PEZI
MGLPSRTSGTVEKLPTLRYEDYTIGWVPVLEIEEAAAISMLDRKHNDLPPEPRDPNVYTLGRIGEHNVVIVRFERKGIDAAAFAVENMFFSFPNMQFVFVVGVGGGAPGPAVPYHSKEEDLRLGDVVVGVPNGDRNYAVVQHDYRRENSDGTSEILCPKYSPPKELEIAVRNLEKDHAQNKSMMLQYIQEGIHDLEGKLEIPGLPNTCTFPGRHKDRLFLSSYRHPDDSSPCEECNPNMIIQRKPRNDTSPKIHHGVIGTGDRLIKWTNYRDRLRETEGVMCFEMETRGVVDFPSLSIRGISDYSDGHKNKFWQPYAAVAAAAYAKDVLRVLPPVVIEDEMSVIIEAEPPIIPEAEPPVILEVTSPAVLEAELPDIPEPQLQYISEPQLQDIPEPQLSVVLEPEPPIIPEPEPPAIPDAKSPATFEVLPLIIPKAAPPVPLEAVSPAIPKAVYVPPYIPEPKPPVSEKDLVVCTYWETDSEMSDMSEMPEKLKFDKGTL